MSDFVRSILVHNLHQTFPIKKNKERRDFSWRFLPYALMRIKSGKFLVLNRANLPLGIETTSTINPDDAQYLYSTVDDCDVSPLVRNLAAKEKQIYFIYNDQNSPRYNSECANLYIKNVLYIFSPMFKGEK